MTVNLRDGTGDRLSSPDRRQAVEPGSRAVEQISFLVRRATRRDALERVPQYRICAHPLIDREIAFEHAPGGTEGFDRGLHVRSPRRRHLAGAWRQRLM